MACGGALKEMWPFGLDEMPLLERNDRSCLINSKNLPMPRVKPASEAGFTGSTEATAL
jgi:hypothetical protein